MRLLLFTFFLAAGVAVAMPTANGLFVRDSSNSSASEYLSPEQIHANILKAWPANKIIVSQDLDKYVVQNPDAAGSTVYLKDTRTFMEIHANTTLESRETCRFSTSRTVLRTQVVWDPWEPLSHCIKTDKDPNGGSTSIQYSTTKGTSWDAGLTIGPFKDLIGAAVGFSVINTYTVGQGYTCNVPGHSVGQVWGRHRMAWAEVKESVCSTCSGCQRGTQGYIRMPKYNPSDPLDGQVLGCSVGEIFTRC